MTPQSEDSKKRMGGLAITRYTDEVWPEFGDVHREAFKAGYLAGMQDPEANAGKIKSLEYILDLGIEKIKKLEGLLGECEKNLDQAVRQWEMHASFHEEDYGDPENIEAKLVNEMKEFLEKLKSAKEEENG